MKIAEIMSTTVDVISPQTGIQEAAQRMRDENVGALPVGEDDRLIGIVTDRDIAVRGVAEGKLDGNPAVRDVMSERVHYCFEDAEIEDAASVMAEHQVHRLPVLNRDKRLVGVIATADIARTGSDAIQMAMVGISEATNGAARR